MIRRAPTAITLDISDVEEYDDLRRMYQQEEVWRTEMAKNATQQGDNHETDYLLNQTLAESTAKDNNDGNDTAASAEASSSTSFVAKRRRIANSSRSQRRSADARKRLGLDDASQA